MLDHPNLIRFFGVVQEDPQLNIFVEWMPGGSVSKLLDKHGSFNDNVIMKYTYQILQGLDYLHHHGILHRDLKGKNFMYALESVSLADSKGQIKPKSRLARCRFSQKTNKRI